MKTIGPTAAVPTASRPLYGHPVTVAAIMLLLGMIPCCVDRTERDWPTTKQEVREAFPEVRQLTTSDLAVWLASDRPPPTLLDARMSEEFAVSHLQGAIPAEDIDQAVAALNGREAAGPIVVYCSVGYRSSALAQELMGRGYEGVMNLEGSIFEWANAGRPVVRDGRAVEAVHPYNEDWGRLLERHLRATEPDPQTR